VDIAEALASALVVLLALASLAALYVGILGIFGVAHLTRCDHCGRLAFTGGREPPRSCLYCRHERLVHPVATLHSLASMHHHQGSGS
jgi:hypothetical protein